MLANHDHRSIGARLDLFHLQEEAQGSVFWHPRGLQLYRLVEEYVRSAVREDGYEEVKTPQLLSRSIWEASGHWENFRENMFVLEDDLALKPVSCPGHIQIFANRVRSWRELPLRLAEFGACHRNEPSGVLLGLMRVRAFVQDDGHVFCTEAQVEAEVARFCERVRRVYAAFGLGEPEVKLSTRPAQRAGSDALWDRAESALAAAAQKAGLSFELQAGEGAFYGPKIEFAVRDSHGRVWQCGTVQLDFVLPERFDLGYVAPHGGRERPVMIHRAILGSLERFLGILLEHHRGRLPFWLAPEQVAIAPVAEAQRPYAEEVAQALRRAGLRPVIDARDESLGRKVAEAQARGVPALWVIGAREVEARSVSIRDVGVLPLAEAVEGLRLRAQPPPR